ncbi:MAG: hypothetical protein R6U20_05590, partial [Longimonas sp.]|uniref:hypothetical protein n=1 Tax=Longimonas sp. TaxID=2039626 RepID=UPI003976FD6B
MEVHKRSRISGASGARGALPVLNSIQDLDDYKVGVHALPYESRVAQHYYSVNAYLSSPTQTENGLEFEATLENRGKVAFFFPSQLTIY